MSQRKFGNSLAEQLRAAGWQPSQTKAPEERRKDYLNAPPIGRVMLNSENSLAGIYEYLQTWSIVKEKSEAPYIAIVRPQDYERCRPDNVHTVFETLPNHPFYDPGYANVSIECETKRAMLRRVRRGEKLVPDFRLVVHELASASYRLQDERTMVLDHMSTPDTRPTHIFTSLAIIKGHHCTPTDLVNNAPLPEVLTFGPLQLLSVPERA